MDPRLFPDDLRRSLRLATTGVVIRLAMLVLPLNPTDTGFRSSIDFARPALDWGSGVGSGVALIVLALIARSRLRQDPPGRFVASGALIALGIVLGVSAIATFMAWFQFVREFGDLLDMGFGPLWIYLALGAASGIAFTAAGILALRPEPIERRPRRARRVPLPPPPPT